MCSLVTKTDSDTTSKFQSGYQVETTKKLNKESLIYCYLIYTIDT